MSILVSFRGVSYTIPEPGDANTQSLTDYLNALSTGAVPYTFSGNDVDFGATLGVKAGYFKTRAALPAASGVLRLSTGDSVAWRNTANGADLLLGHDTGDALTYNGANVTGNAYLGANQTVATSLVSGTATIVVFNVIETDTDGGYNAGTGRYTIPAGKGGRYFIASTIEFNPGASTTAANISVFKNAAVSRVGDQRFTSASTANDYHVATIISCVPGDVLDVRGYQTTGGPINTSAAAADNWLTIHRLVG